MLYLSTAGYVQGMSDLLAPLLSVMENEVDTFWCFAGFMEMVVHVVHVVVRETLHIVIISVCFNGILQGHHFEVSQTGMRNRLKQLRALLNVSDPKFYQFLS